MNKTPWFEEWFDTKYYHLLYQDRDHEEAKNFIDCLVAELNPSQGATFLDLACGKGRHSIQLNSKGFDVTGVDLSEQSINAAKEFENPTLRFDTHDLRDVYKDVKFDYIVNLFTSFGYFEDFDDNQKAMNAMAANLKADGSIIIDFMNSFYSAARMLHKERKDVEENGKRIQFNLQRKLEHRVFVKDIEFVYEKRLYRFQERVQGLVLKDFEEYCDKAGLEIVETYGSYELDYFSKNTSKRLILKIQHK